MNLNQVTIPSTDLDSSIHFYEKLGLKLIVHSPPRYARFECPQGDTTLSIHLVKELPKGEGITLYFECEELDLKVKELMDLGLKFEHPPVDQRWLWREARINDPHGNRLILYYGGENRKNPPWKIES